MMLASGIARGMSIAAAAVFEINAPLSSVRPATSRITSCGGWPARPASWSAIQSETPVETRMVPIESPPPKVSSAFQLIRFRSSSRITPPMKSARLPPRATIAVGI